MWSARRLAQHGVGCVPTLSAQEACHAPAAHVTVDVVFLLDLWCVSVFGGRLFLRVLVAVLRGGLGHRSLHRVGSLHALGFVERGGGRFVVLGLFRRPVEVDVHKRPRSVGCWLAAKSVS